MQAAAEASPSGMVSIVGPDVAQVAELVKEAKSAGKMELANYLCPGNTVVSGDLAACAAIEKLAEAKGARTIRLAVAGAFHTELMKPADEKLARGFRNGGAEVAANSGLVERRCQAAHRSGRDSRLARQAGSQPGSLGRNHEKPAGGRGRTVLRDRPGPGAGGAIETGQSEDRLPQLHRLTPDFRGGFPEKRAGISFLFWVSLNTFLNVMPVGSCRQGVYH